MADLAELLCRTDPELRPSASDLLERLDALGGGFGCGCPGCPGIARPGGDGRGGSPGRRNGGGSGGEDLSSARAGDVRLREELAAKTRKVEEQVRMRGRAGGRLLVGAAFCFFWFFVHPLNIWPLCPAIL